MRALPARHRGPTDHNAQMTLKLTRIGLAGPVMFFNLRVTNHSDIDYNLDFVRLYVRDKQKMKRTSVQEREVLPIYDDSTSLIYGHSSVSKILALPTFTLAGGKEFIIEAYEKNGGRSLRIFVHNKTLLKATKL